MTGGVCTLVIHPGALGDVLQTVPALRSLRRAGRVTLAAQPRLGELVHGLGVADAALSFEGLGLGALFTDEPAPAPLAARLGEYTRVVSWFGSRDALYPTRLGAIARHAVVAPAVPQGERAEPVWRHLLAIVGDAGPADTAPVRVPATWRARARQVLAALGGWPSRPVLLVHAGAGGAWKRWPTEAFAAVAAKAVRELGVQILLHQGPADAPAVERLGERLGAGPGRLVEPALPLLAGVLAEVDAYLGGDSGVSQLAAAAGAPGVILYPASTLERWAPWCPATTPFAMAETPGALEAVSAALAAALSRPRTS